MKIFKSILTIIIFSSFTIIGKNEIKVYVIPFEHNYLIDITEDKIMSHTDAFYYSSENKVFRKALCNFIESLDTLKVNSTEVSIDIRVLLRFKEKGENVQIGFDRYGQFVFKNKIYEPSLDILRIIEKHNPKIKWNK